MYVYSQDNSTKYASQKLVSFSHLVHHERWEAHACRSALTSSNRVCHECRHLQRVTHVNSNIDVASKQEKANE